MPITLTNQYLIDLAKPTEKKIAEALDAGQFGLAKRLCDEFQREYILLHDIYLDWTTGLLSYVGENHSQEDVREATIWSVGQYLRPLYDIETTAAATIEESGQKDGATDMFVATKRSSDKDKLINWTSIWHAHFASFKEIEEREDCFLLHQDPCGSGGRLLRSGGYQAPKWYHIVPEMKFSVRQEKNFPVYCYHCFAGIEGNLELTGKTVFGIDAPPKSKNDICVFRIPKEIISGNRLFDEAELKELYKPKMTRAKEAIDHHDLERAKKLAREWRSDCLANHDIYRNWTTALLTFIYNRWGYQGLVEALRRSIRAWAFHPLSEPGLETVQQQLVDADLVVRMENLARTLRADCGNFELKEDEEKFIVVYECGSGGRLIKEGAYEKRGWAKVKEASPLTRNISNYPIYCAACKAVTDTLVHDGQLPIIVDHESQTPGNPCKVYIYKDPGKIPEKYLAMLTPELIQRKESAG